MVQDCCTSTLVLLALSFMAVAKAQTGKTLPSAHEINLALTQTERAIQL
jgi:hypothetical protein